jgi:O-antigen/teichoic acid export membrane protein
MTPKLQLTKLQAAISGPAKALAGIGLTIIIVQGLSFFANVLIVRTLSVAEYALLTSSLSILGLLTAIADSGLSQAAMTVGGQHHKSDGAKAEVLQRCRGLVLRTGAIGLVIIVPIWIWMARKLDVGGYSLVPVGVFLFGGFFLVLGLNIYKSFLLLEGRRVFTQKVDVARTVLRLVCLVSGIYAFPSAAYVILCAFIAEFFGWWCFRVSLSHLMPPQVVCSPLIRAEVDAVFWKLMPATIYKAVSPQIFLLLLIAFGSTASVAGAGALSRFHQVFIFVPSIGANVFNPRLARASGVKQRSRSMLIFVAAAWGSALLIFLCLWLFATPLLALLGPNYSGLQTDFRMLMASSCMYIMSGSCSGLLNTRGWIVPPALLIGSDLSFSILAILLCDLGSLSGFTAMHCILAAGSLATSIGWMLHCFLSRRDG